MAWNLNKMKILRLQDQPNHKKKEIYLHKASEMKKIIKNVKDRK